MIVDLLFIAGGFALLFIGADRLIAGAVRLSLRSGISPLIIGLTIVAFGTSTPELFVSLRANLTGSGDIAMGNIIGSNIFNLAVILGISALIQPINVKSQLIQQDIPVMIGATLLFFAMARNLTIERWEGGVLFTLLVAYILLNVRLARRHAEPELSEEFEHHMPKAPGTLPADIFWMTLGIGLLVAGSNLLVAGAVSLAEAAGVSKALIGLTLVAAGTGLPELATSIVAAIKKESDLAVGNIVGSNIFNILCIAGLSPLVKAISFPDIEIMDLAVLAILSILLLPISWTGMRLGRREGVLFLASYAAYLYYIWPHAR
ncbi:MAG TPA: calcium/sodium antiporter [Kiritimatiellia bacterium]|nr:calcium/sodium antiporter [Kiritimatiellia bacterium]